MLAAKCEESVPPQDDEVKIRYKSLEQLDEIIRRIEQN
jgi:hypothetical protein